MNNEPIAWAIKSDGDFTEIGWDDEVLYEIEEWYTAQGWNYEHIPLYTHPVKEQELLDEIAQLKHINRNWQISENILLLELEKLQMRELTDEEIEECYWGDGYPDNPRHPKEFAYAILRKAQEK